MSDQLRCETCRYFEHSYVGGRSALSDVGICRRYPPTLISPVLREMVVAEAMTLRGQRPDHLDVYELSRRTPAAYGQPTVDGPDDWCGEHQPASMAAPVAAPG